MLQEAILCSYWLPLQIPGLRPARLPTGTTTAGHREDPPQLLPLPFKSIELTFCRFSRGRLAGPRMRTPLRTLFSIGSVKFCQIGSYSSLAFWPQTSENSWLSRAASSCGHQEGKGVYVGRGHGVEGGEEGQGLLETRASWRAISIFCALRGRN